MDLKGSFARGRGASENPANRFEKLHVEPEADFESNSSTDKGSEPSLDTVFLRDTSRSIIAYNDSPDVGFDASVNPYRGCEHGCIYCYARPTHEYLGFSSGLDFESKILVKEEAPKLLREKLSSSRWKPQVVAVSGVTDPYQPVERRLRLTRGCLEVLAEFRNPVVIVSKNYLVARDIDLLRKLAAYNAAAVFVSITTLDSNLARRMEPRASTPERRLDAVRALNESGIPVGVMVAPTIPGLTDHEMPSIIEAAVGAGAKHAGFVVLRLPFAVKGLFEKWLEQHFPDKRDKVLNRIRSVRGGKLNDPSFGSRMRGEGIFAEQVELLFNAACRKYGIFGWRPRLSTAHFRRPTGAQFELFDR
jgi:DNA repair photolyase